MTVAYQAIGTVLHESDLTMTPSLGGTTASNDVALACGLMRNTGTSGDMSVAQGANNYTALEARTSATTLNSGIFARLTGASESAPTITWTAAGGFVTSGLALFLRGLLANIGTVKHTSSTGSNTNTSTIVPFSAATITRPGCVIVDFATYTDESTDMTHPDTNADEFVGFRRLAYSSTAIGGDQSVGIWIHVQGKAANRAAEDVTITGGAAAGISRGFRVVLLPATILVPNVENLTEAAATTELTDWGFTVGASVSASSGSVPAGSVISYSPTGEQVFATEVILTVSTGPSANWTQSQHRRSTLITM